MHTRSGQHTEDVVEHHEETIDQIAALLAVSRSVLFITGAGISADSGLPTYRGPGGLHTIDTTEDGIPIERALSADIMIGHPELTWKYLAHLERTCRGASCNRAHEVIAQMEGHFERVWTLTQNVDGLHRAAGARHVIDIHGDLHRLRCMRCLHRETVEDYRALTFPPRCPRCPGLLRPDVVLFGEPLAPEKIMMLLSQLDDGFDVVFTIGTTSTFPYIAQPVLLAASQGRPTVEINPGLSEVSDVVSFRLPLRAGPALEAVWDRYRQAFAPTPRPRGRRIDPREKVSSAVRPEDLDDASPPWT